MRLKPFELVSLATSCDWSNEDVAAVLQTQQQAV